MPCYFFSGARYIRVTRGNTGPGTVDPGYPAPISNWGWGSFGSNGIDATLFSGPKCYFFSGARYIRVTRGNTGPGTVDPGYPAPISNWGWGSFGSNGIDAALYSGPKCYFFSGARYIRVTRGNTGPGTVDPGYPAPISNWGWGSFGSNGIDAALYSGPKCYFFSGARYIRVTRGNTGPGTVDPGYPAPISNWGWGSFGSNGIDAALFSGVSTVITFDDLPAGTHEVSDQYQAEGVVFTGASLPSVVPAPAGQAQSGTHVASILQYGGEFVTPQVSGTFTNLHQHVKVYVGEFEEAVPQSAQLTMRAYDANHNLIAQSNPVTVYSGAGFHTPLEVDSPTPNIASFEVTGRKPVSGDVGDLDKRVAIDDLTFDNPTVDYTWRQVNEDGFFGLSVGDTAAGAPLFTFGDHLYLRNTTEELFMMSDPITRDWQDTGLKGSFTVIGDFLYREVGQDLFFIPKGASPLGTGWNKVTSQGLPGGGSPSPRTVFENQVYGVYNTPDGFQIYRSSDIGKVVMNWEVVATNSFGNPEENQQLAFLAVFGDRLCAGTDTRKMDLSFGDPAAYMSSGVEIWESSTGDLNSWKLVNNSGFGTKHQVSYQGTLVTISTNQTIMSWTVYKAPGEQQAHLYVGTATHFAPDGQIWRVRWDGDYWVAGCNSAVGAGSGDFGRSIQPNSSNVRHGRLW